LNPEVEKLVSLTARARLPAMKTDQNKKNPKKRVGVTQLAVGGLILIAVIIWGLRGHHDFNLASDKKVVLEEGTIKGWDSPPRSLGGR
jgi:hypothetical protein